MNIEPARETIKYPPEQFAGDVWLDLIAVPHGPEQRAVDHLAMTTIWAEHITDDEYEGRQG
jgi:hypothetical protein